MNDEFHPDALLCVKFQIDFKHRMSHKTSFGETVWTSREKDSILMKVVCVVRRKSESLSSEIVHLEGQFWSYWKIDGFVCVCVCDRFHYNFGRGHLNWSNQDGWTMSIGHHHSVYNR